MKKVFIFALFLLGIFLFPIQKEAAAELISFSVSSNESRGHSFYSGLVVFDNQSFYLHLDDKGEKEKVRAESFLILSPEALENISEYGKIKKEEVFAVKILQEFHLGKEEYRVIRIVFFDGAGNQLLEKSFDQERWLPLTSKKGKITNQYFVKLYGEIYKVLEDKEESTFLRY